MIKQYIAVFTWWAITVLLSGGARAQLINQGDAERLAFIFKASSNHDESLSSSTPVQASQPKFQLQTQEFNLFYKFIDIDLLDAEASTFELSQAEIGCMAMRLSAELPELRSKVDLLSEQLLSIRKLVKNNGIANAVISNLASPNADASVKELLTLLIFDLHSHLRDFSDSDVITQLDSTLSNDSELASMVKYASFYRLSFSNSSDRAAVLAHLIELKNTQFWMPFTIPEGNANLSLAITTSTSLQPRCIVYPSERDIFEGYRANKMSSYARSLRSEVFASSIGAATDKLFWRSPDNAIADFKLLEVDFKLCCARALQQDSISSQIESIARFGDLIRVVGVKDYEFDEELITIRNKYKNYDEGMYEKAVMAYSPPINAWDFCQEVRAIAQAWERRLLSQSVSR